MSGYLGNIQPVIDPAPSYNTATGSFKLDKVAMPPSNASNGGTSTIKPVKDPANISTNKPPVKMSTSNTQDSVNNTNNKVSQDQAVLFNIPFAGKKYPVTKKTAFLVLAGTISLVAVAKFLK